MMIALSQDTKLVYEGESNHGYGLWPTPVLSIASVVSGADDLQGLPPVNDLYSAKLVFREDSFDPTTRVRRGRLYATPGVQPDRWTVFPQSFMPSQGLTSMNLHGFSSNAARPVFQTIGAHSLLALGSADAFTLWRIVAKEQIANGEFLLTLKARSSLGTLPELDAEKLPTASSNRIHETLGKLSDAAYRSGPEAVVDRARDAAQWCIGAWLADRQGDEALRLLDLGTVTAKVSDQFQVVRSIGVALARLHARAKPNENERRSARPLEEDDAEFALAAMAVLLRELGWVRTSAPGWL